MLNKGRKETAEKSQLLSRAFPAPQLPFPLPNLALAFKVKRGISQSRGTAAGNLGVRPAEGTSEMRLEQAGSGSESFLVKLL